MEELFNGRSVFITGASGFVGKVLIEKLLRSLPGIATIFVLIRPLKGSSGVSRWQDIESTVFFNVIRRKFPERLRKVVVIEGDITEDDFGISSVNLDRVLSETSVVFHCAATVKFNDSLKNSSELNVKGVTRMIALCHRMPKLEAFLHCSTAFANAITPGEIVAEKMYPSQTDVNKLLTVLEILDDSQIDLISGDIAKSHMNTYCFTKYLGEMYAGAIPRFPMLSVNPKSILDVVPVDVVTNMMISCASYRMNYHCETIPVFHCCSSDLNPCNFGTLTGHGIKYATKYPAEKMLSPPTFAIEGFNAVEVCRHNMRARCLGPLLDVLMRILRQEPFWTRLYAKLSTSYEMLIPFGQYWHFESSGMLKLIGMMAEQDRQNFNFDIRQLKWNEYACDYLMGVKTFLMKDDIADPSAITRAKLRLLCHQLFCMLPVISLCYAISVIVTGHFTAWLIFLPLVFVAAVYTLMEWIMCTKMKTIEEYRCEIEGIIGEPIKSKKTDKNVV